jgi:hypothetical protein
MACLLILIVHAGLPAAADETTPVLATIGNIDITLEEFAVQHAELVSWFGLGVQTPEVQRVLEEMIFTRLLAREADQSGLAEQHLVRLQLDRILSAAYLSSRLSGAQLSVSEAEAQSYYEAHQDRFRLPTQIRLAHILVRSEQDARLLQQALKSGQAFDQLATRHSLDPASSHAGGALGWVEPDHLMPPLAEAVLALQPGQQRIVKTPLGYHLILLQEKPPAQFQPFDSVRRDLHHAVLQQKKETQRQTIKHDLWQKYRVAIHQDQLHSLVQPSATHSGDGTRVIYHDGNQGLERRGPTPQLQALLSTYNLGAIAPTPLTHTSLVSNLGTAELIIHKVHTTCRCATASITPTKLAPGQTAQLIFTFDPNMFKEHGRITKVIHIETNDPATPRSSIRMRADIVREGHTRDG